MDCVVYSIQTNCKYRQLQKENAELKDKLDDAKEIIEQMKDLFFDCWQERGYKAMKFEERVNNFIKECEV